MPPSNPTADKDRLKDGVIDQRAQQIDPAGHNRTDDNDRPANNTKQPGGRPSDADDRK